MEIYNFYQMATIIASLFTTENVTMFMIAAAISVVLWGGVFVLQGFGIYAMAKKQGLKNKALAFVPFVNIWYIGKLAGECHFFGQRMKRAGTYAMIAQILATLLCVLSIAAEQYLWITQGEPKIETNYGYYYWTGLTGFALTVSKFYDISGYILPIFQLFVEIFLVVLMMSLCKKYAPKNYMFLSMLTLFIPVSRFFIIFALRNRAPIDYESYMRARHEAYMRRQQQYYNQQNPYNNPYGRPYNPYNNPYGQNPNAQNTPPQQDEPFAEFSSDKKGKNSDEPFEEMKGDQDDFFS